MSIILASQSPRRRELLKRIIKNFKSITPGCREYHRTQWNESKNAIQNALRKANAVSVRNRSSLVIGCDTIVAYKGQMLGKPKSRMDAKRILNKLSGKTHHVVTGVALVCPRQDIEITFSVITKVKMKKWNDSQIEDYLKAVHVMDKAGSYGIQETPKIVQSIMGSYTNVMGLPVERLRKEMKKLGIK